MAIKGWCRMKVGGGGGFDNDNECGVCYGNDGGKGNKGGDDDGVNCDRGKGKGNNGGGEDGNGSNDKGDSCK